LPALAVGDLVAGAPGNAPVAELVGQAAVQWLLRTLAQARADHDLAGVAVGRLDHARDVAGLVLAVAVHGQHRARALAQRLAEAVAERGALAHGPRVAQQRDRQVRELGHGVVVGAVVHHDHPGALRERALDHAADAQRFVEGGDHHGDLGRFEPARLELARFVVAWVIHGQSPPATIATGLRAGTPGRRLGRAPGTRAASVPSRCRAGAPPADP